MATGNKNAIEERLDVIHALWLEAAADPVARIHRWLLADDEFRMLEGFAELQDEQESESPELFIRFREAFPAPGGYGAVLAEELRRQFMESRDAIAAEGLPVNWQLPGPVSGQTDPARWLQVWGSFIAAYRDCFPLFVAVLLPDDVPSARRWVEWIDRLLVEEWPDKLRVMVLDRKVAPVLTDVAQRHGPKMRSITPALDMPAAYRDLAKGQGKGGPDSAFRLQFLQMNQAVAAGDMAQVEQFAAGAAGVAVQQGWADMQAVVAMAVAAAQLTKDPLTAVESYRQAGQKAEAAKQKQHPAAPKLLLQSKLGEAGAWFSAGRHGDAARVYEEAANFAGAAGDHLMTMESLRMASYCHAANKLPVESWRCGCSALDVAEKLEPEMRKNSTLPHLGQAMLALVETKKGWFRGISAEDRERAAWVRRRIAELAGPDWEQKLQKKEAAA